MTIRQVHLPAGCPLTLDEWRALDPDNPTETGTGPARPLTGSGYIGDRTSTTRANDAAASSAFTESDRPAMRTRWRAVGPRGYATDLENTNAERARWTNNPIRKAQADAARLIDASVDASDAQTVGTHPHDPDTANRHTDPSRGTSVPRRTENPK